MRPENLITVIMLQKLLNNAIKNNELNVNTDYVINENQNYQFRLASIARIFEINPPVLIESFFIHLRLYDNRIGKQFHKEYFPNEDEIVFEKSFID